jgi:hypothetical protein
MSNLRLKSVLAQFLRGDSEMFYPVLETRILQFNPLQITDDYETYIDISALQDEVFDQVSNQDLGYKLILNNWHFIFKRVPNTHEYYFDIMADNYRVIEVNTLLELDTFPSKMMDEDDIRFYFEARKRREIEDLIKKNMRIKTSPFKRNSATHTPGKSSAYKTPVYFKSPSSYSYRDTQSLGWTPNPYNRPNYPASAYMGGVKKSVGKETSFDDILCIEELLDVPRFIPNVKKVMMPRTPMKYGWGDSSTHAVTPSKIGASSDFGLKSSIKKVSEGFEGSEKSTPSLAGRTGKDVTMDDINEGLKSGLLNWNQISFNRDAFAYLQKNIHIIETNK